MKSEMVQDLWFLDGNIIIRVDATQICCVHKSVLAANSPVLSDMFSVPQPVGSETIDGLPVVTLPDSPQDVMYWLKSMLVPGDFEVYPRHIRMDKVLAVLRLSHKYGVQHLRQCALYHLSTAFPIDQEGVENIENTTISDFHDVSVEQLLQVNALAQEVNALWLIPFAMYQLHTKTWSNKAAQQVLLESPLVTRLDLICLADVARIATIEFSLRDLTQFSRAELAACDHTGLSSCASIIRQILMESHKQLIATPLTFLRLATEDFLSGETKYDTVHALIGTVLCSRCSKVVLSEIFWRAYRRFWDALARDLGLGFDRSDDMLMVRKRDTGVFEADA
ncbi:hypothetical protein EV714DRAFT_208687 [Schizophyllum commune]